LVWNRAHLQRVLTTYLAHYNTARPHRSINLQAPIPTTRRREMPPAPQGLIERVDVLDGLIHEYRHAA
jgi:putative transposase